MYGLCISIYFVTFCANTRGTTGKAWVAVNLTLRERSANSCRKQSVSSNCSGNGDLRGSCRNNQNIWKYASPKALRLAETILSLTGLRCRRWFHSKKSKKQTWGIWEPYFMSLLHTWAAFNIHSNAAKLGSWLPVNRPLLGVNQLQYETGPFLSLLLLVSGFFFFFFFLFVFNDIIFISNIRKIHR